MNNLNNLFDKEVINLIDNNYTDNHANKFDNNYANEFDNNHANKFDNNHANEFDNNQNEFDFEDKFDNTLKNYINDFILNKKPTKLPIPSIRATRKNKFDIIYKKFIISNKIIIDYPSDGFYYTNSFYKFNNNIYVLTFYQSKLINYAIYKLNYQ